MTETLSNIYGTGVTGIDLFAYSPARIADYLAGRIELDGTLLLLHDIGISLTILFAVMFVFILIQFRKLSFPGVQRESGEDSGTFPIPDGPLQSQWHRVLGHLDSPRETDWKLAIMEADKLADRALLDAGYPGAGIGERLMNVPSGQLVSLDGLWWAHKVRNRLAHEMDYFLRYTEARQAITYYEQSLNELKAI